MPIGQRLQDLLGEVSSSEEIQKEFLILEDARTGASKEEQNKLAPLAHAKYTEGVVTDNPITAIPLAAAIPIYTTGKAIGAIKTRSDPSWEEVSQAYKGISKGLYNAIFRKSK